MKINLNQAEIHRAILEYVGAQGITLSEKQTSVQLTAGRGQNGFYADIEIEDAAENTPDTEEIFGGSNVAEDDQALDLE